MLGALGGGGEEEGFARGRRLIFCIFVGIVMWQKLLKSAWYTKRRSMNLRNQECLRLQDRECWRPEQGLQPPTDNLKVFCLLRAHSGCSLGTGSEEVGVVAQGRAGRCSPGTE